MRSIGCGVSDFGSLIVAPMLRAGGTSEKLRSQHRDRPRSGRSICICSIALHRETQAVRDWLRNPRSDRRLTAALVETFLAKVAKNRKKSKGRAARDSSEEEAADHREAERGRGSRRSQSHSRGRGGERRQSRRRSPASQPYRALH